MKLIQHFANAGSLDFVAQGESTPEQSKANLIEVLRPHFENEAVLDRLAVLLAPEAVNLREIEQDPPAQLLYKKVQAEYRKARDVSADLCFEGCRIWEQKVLDGTAEYWSALRLNVDLASLTIHDFKFESFRIIGLLIEAVMQPALRALLFQARVAARRPQPSHQLDWLDLGVVVEELSSEFGYVQYLTPQPWDIPLNQWRNLAQHYSTKVEGNRIVGAYGKGTRKHHVCFRRPELLAATYEIHGLSRALKTARSIFILDNIDDVRLQWRDFEIRDDTTLAHLQSELATQGFEIFQFELRADVVEVSILDLCVAEPLKRFIHSSQLAVPIWSRYPRGTIIVKYFRNDGTLLGVSTASGDDCKAISDGSIQLEELAHRIHFKLTELGRAVLQPSGT